MPSLVKISVAKSAYADALEGLSEDLLALVQNENKTFIFVTHSIEEAVYVSDQIAILLPRPSRVSEIIRPEGLRTKDVDNIRRDPEYLDTVDRIWALLRTYVE